MRDDIRAEVEGAAVDRSRERVVDDERHPVRMREARELLDVEHDERGVRERLGENGLGVRPESLGQINLRQIGIDEREVDAHALHRHGEEIRRPPVERGGGHDVIARPGDVEDGEEVRRLPGGREHRGRAALQFADLRGDGVARRVLQPGVEIAARFEGEELAHVLAAVVLERRALDDGQDAGLARLRLPAALHAARVNARFHVPLSRGPAP